MIKKKGVTAVETVFMLPILILVLTYTLTGGQLVINEILCKNAVEDSLRTAVVQTNEKKDIVAKRTFSSDVKNAFGIIGGSDNIKITSDGDWRRGNTATANGSIQFRAFIPIPTQNGFTSLVTMNKKATMAIEYNG